jgi:hypothetical protein
MATISPKDHSLFVTKYASKGSTADSIDLLRNQSGQSVQNLAPAPSLSLQKMAHDFRATLGPHDWHRTHALGHTRRQNRRERAPAHRLEAPSRAHSQWDHQQRQRNSKGTRTKGHPFHVGDRHGGRIPSPYTFAVVCSVADHSPWTTLGDRAARGTVLGRGTRPEGRHSEGIGTDPHAVFHATAPTIMMLAGRLGTVAL